jgi:toxin-antitoxin system PIN domain toxin
MILVDVNLLLYASDGEAKQHRQAKQWLEDAVAGPDQVRFAWLGVVAFLRIITNPRMTDRAIPIEEAAAVVDDWLRVPNVGVLNPGERHWAILSKLLSAAQVRGPLVSDAHLAALAIEHGATLATNDRDFTRFPGLKLSFPLSGG